MLTQDVDTRSGATRNALRVSTRGIHEQFHEHSHFVALFNGTINPTQYRDLMIAFHGFYKPMERAITRLANHEPHTSSGFDYPKRTSLLAQDLASLGLAPAEIDQNPECPRMSKLVTPATLAGVLYVIEGSTLGAAQIDRAAQKILSAENVEGRRFWAWSRANNTARWAAINAYLNRFDASPHNRAAILRGANETFEALATWLAPLQQHNLAQEVVAP